MHPSELPEAVLEGSYAECERLAGRDKPHLYAAANLFARPEARRAFIATYASMRLIDDAVDGIPNRASLADDVKRRELTQILQWYDRVKASHGCSVVTGSTWPALADTFSRFDFPLDPWFDLAKAMTSDVLSSSFHTWEDLRSYMQGASVAPAVVFMYLVLMRPNDDGRFRTGWSYERVHAATEDLAIFCYSVHILRDVAADLSLGESGLVYLPRAELSEFGLSDADLFRMRDQRRGNESYRRLARHQARRAREYLDRGRRQMDEVLKEAEPSNGLALTTLVDTYERVLNELQDRDFDVFAACGDSN